MANIHVGYANCSSRNIVFLSEDSLATVIPAGIHEIQCCLEAEGPICGVVPIGQECTRIFTKGLKWNLDGTRPLSFGKFISTSNEFHGSSVFMNNSHPVLWTTSLRKEALV
mmetsp:Transcript_17839/g.29321  ORF Transcript_17839/g.29321 Transcript_17839/m.29321 type:complete len:111 (-) Transcript_17839:247-579(-)